MRHLTAPPDERSRSVISVAVLLATVVAVWVLVAERISGTLAARFGIAAPTMRMWLSLVVVAVAALILSLALRRFVDEVTAAHRGWEQLAASIDDGLFLLEVNGRSRFLYLNPAVERILGLPVERLEADPYAILGLAEGGDREVLSELFTSPDGPDSPTEFTITRPDGRQRRLRLSGAVLQRTPERSVLQGLLVDVTEQHDREAALADVAESERAAAAELRHLSDLRAGLVTAMSHELRTPLTVIRGAAELLHRNRQRLTPERQQALEQALLEQTARLSGLLDDVLSIGRMQDETQQRRRPERLTDIGHVVREAVARSPIVDRIHCEIDDAVFARGDEAQLGRMVSELLSNAEKYAPDSPVNLNLRNGGRCWTLTVSDHGPGLSDRHQGHVLEPFYRADMEHPKPGLGLGLTLVASVAAQHGGSVELTTGDGLTVVVNAPADAVGHQDEDTPVLVIRPDGPSTLTEVRQSG